MSICFDTPRFSKFPVNRVQVGSTSFSSSSWCLRWCVVSPSKQDLGCFTEHVIITRRKFLAYASSQTSRTPQPFNQPGPFSRCAYFMKPPTSTPFNTRSNDYFRSSATVENPPSLDSHGTSPSFNHGQSSRQYVSTCSKILAPLPCRPDR